MHERRGPRAALVVALLAVTGSAAVSPVAGALLAAAIQLTAAAAGARVLSRRPRHGLLTGRAEALAPWGAVTIVAAVAALTSARALGVSPEVLRLVVVSIVIVAVTTLMPLAVTRAGARARAPGHAWVDAAIAVVGLGVAVLLCVRVAPGVGLGRLETGALVVDVALLAVNVWLRSTRVHLEPVLRTLSTIAMVLIGLDVLHLLVPTPAALLTAVLAATSVLAAVHLVHAGTSLGVPIRYAASQASAQRTKPSRLMLAVPFVSTVPLAGVVGRLVPEAALAPSLLAVLATVLMALALVRAHGLVSVAESHAERDVLTGLHDRRGFVRAMEEDGHLRTGDAKLCLVDLDGFKLVNDRLGHAAGDALLIAIARRLATTMPAGTVLGRLGGDELVVLVHARDAQRAARSVLGVFDAPFDLGGEVGDLVATASVGVTDVSDTMSVDEILKRADVAMYTAKHGGRDRWALYERGQREKVLGAAATLVELRALLGEGASPEDPGHLVLHHQPIIDLVTGRPHSLECLVRWEHPRRGLVPPDDFLPLVESAGLGADLDRWVLHAALEQLAAWDTSDAVRCGSVGINLGVSSIRSPTLVEDVDAALAASGLGYERLVLEITEHDEMPFDPLAAQRLLTLRECGVQLWLDDFGTGYSSVGYLRRWPVGCIKLDRSLLPAAGAGSAFAAIDDPLELLDGVVALAAALGHDVVAEGIEDTDDARAVRAVGVRYAQGWLYGRPMPAAALEDWWRERSGDDGAALPTLPPATTSPATPSATPTVTPTSTPTATPTAATSPAAS